MTTVNTITVAEGVEIMTKGGYAPGEFTPQWSRWLDRGDIILIFTNEDLGHPDVGHVMTMPWYADLDEYPLPAHGPDTVVTGLGWRYRLTHIITQESAS